MSCHQRQGLLACRTLKRCSEHFDPKVVEIHLSTLASRVVSRKLLPAPGSRAPGIANGQEEVAIPRGGLITLLLIAAGDPHRGAEQEDASVGDSSSESTWNPKTSDPNSSQIRKAKPHSSDLEDEEQQEVEFCGRQRRMPCRRSLPLSITTDGRLAAFSTPCRQER